MLTHEIMESRGLKFITFPLFSRTGLVKHGFSTRHGGISPTPYKSLNLGFHVGDRAEYVMENRARVARALGIDHNRLVAGAQVHGDRVQVVNREHLGRGGKSGRDALAGVDALVTGLPGVPLAGFYADCVPVFILDPVKKIIALAHAGWKGTVKRIAGKTVSTMVRTFGCKPADCLAVTGPCIGQCCYEVDARVVNKLQESFENWQQFVTPSGEGHWKLNLAGVNRMTLIEAGLKPENVVTVDFCTSCHENLFFSHRASGGRTGRMGSLMVLK